MARGVIIMDKLKKASADIFAFSSSKCPVFIHSGRNDGGGAAGDYSGGGASGDDLLPLPRGPCADDGRRVVEVLLEDGVPVEAALHPGGRLARRLVLLLHVPRVLRLLDDLGHLPVGQRVLELPAEVVQRAQRADEQHGVLQLRAESLLQGGEAALPQSCKQK